MNLHPKATKSNALTISTLLANKAENPAKPKAWKDAQLHKKCGSFGQGVS